MVIWLIESEDSKLMEDLKTMFRKDSNKLILMILDLGFKGEHYEVRLEGLDTISLIIKLSQ